MGCADWIAFQDEQGAYGQVENNDENIDAFAEESVTINEIKLQGLSRMMVFLQEPVSYIHAGCAFKWLIRWLGTNDIFLDTIAVHGFDDDFKFFQD